MSKFFEFSCTTATVLIFLVLNIVLFPQTRAQRASFDENGNLISLSFDNAPPPLTLTPPDTPVPPTSPVSLPEVYDRNGNPVLTNSYYLLIPTNKTNGLSQNVRGVGLSYIKNTCPFHASMSSIARRVTFKPDLPSDDNVVYESDAVKIVYGYPHKDCPEPKVWEVDSDDDENANSRRYIYASGDDFASDVWFQIKRAVDNEFVYKIQFCNNPDIEGVTCKDVNVVNIQPNDMVLTVDDGVPLHVTFVKDC